MRSINDAPAVRQARDAHTDAAGSDARPDVGAIPDAGTRFPDRPHGRRRRRRRDSADSSAPPPPDPMRPGCGGRLPESVASHDRLLVIGDVVRRCGLSRSTVYRLMNEGRFPYSIQVGPRAVRWSSFELEEWVAARPRGAGERRSRHGDAGGRSKPVRTGDPYGEERSGCGTGPCCRGGAQSRPRRRPTGSGSG